MINLPHQNIRRTEIINQLTKLNITNYEFIAAIDGKNLNEIEYFNDPKKTLRHISRELTLTEIGCAMSHLKTYKKLIEDKLDLGIIVEDDVMFEESFLDQFEKDSYDILLLGSTSVYHKKFSPGIYDISQWWEAYGAYAYVITKFGALKMLNYFKEINHPIDSWRTLQKHGIVIKWITPSRVIVNFSLGSYIEEDRIIAKRNAGIFKKSITDDN